MTVTVDPVKARALVDWCAPLRCDRYPTVADCDRAWRDLHGVGGWQVCVAGASSAGRDVLVLERPGDRPGVLAWGYPHPDEPHGAASLIALARAIAERGPPPGLERAGWRLVACADPDQAALNDEWVRRPTPAGWAAGWRPVASGLEVDYGFPVDHPRVSCRRGGPAAPLAESEVLWRVMATSAPDVLGLMHGDTASGAYVYLSQRPDQRMLAALDLTLDQAGVAVHRGPALDPGRRLCGRADVLAEPALDALVERLDRRYGRPPEGQRWALAVSAAMSLSVLASDALVVTPEVGLFEPDGLRCDEPAGVTLAELAGELLAERRELRGALRAFGPVDGRAGPAARELAALRTHHLLDQRALQRRRGSRAWVREATVGQVAAVAPRFRLQTARLCALHARALREAGREQAAAECDRLSVGQAVAAGPMVTVDPSVCARVQVARLLVCALARA